MPMITRQELHAVALQQGCSPHQDHVWAEETQL